MQDQIVGAAIAMGSGLIVLIVTQIFQLIRDRAGRRASYYLALLPKRFEVYQEAYEYCERLKSGIFEENALVMKLTTEAKEWYCKKCLYLTPELRTEFRKAVINLTFCKDLREHWQACAQQNSASEETKKAKKELTESFDHIQTGLQAKLEEEIHKLYYSQVHERKPT